MKVSQLINCLSKFDWDKDVLVSVFDNEWFCEMDEFITDVVEVNGFIFLKI